MRLNADNAPQELGAIEKALSSLSNEELATVTAIAIDILDARSGDCDLEDDDPSGDPLEIDGEAPSDTGTPLYSVKPKYGLDQSAGPINEAEADKAFRAAELRLERSAATWRRAA